MNSSHQKGFALLYALLTVGLLLVVATSISFLLTKELRLANMAKASKTSFYAAEAGLECAFFWDAAGAAFNPNSCSNVSISCDGSNVSTSCSRQGGTTTYTFERDFGEGCANVEVVKNNDDTTTIFARGYNTCNATGNRIERGIRADY